MIFLSESGNKETTNPESTQEEDSSRFPVISSEATGELEAVSVNKNTSHSTTHWMNVFRSWCQSCHYENVNIK